LFRHSPDDDSIAVHPSHFDELAGIDQFAVRYDIHTHAFDLGNASRSQRGRGAPALAEPSPVAFRSRSEPLLCV
jgi:hypothetical protein